MCLSQYLICLKGIKALMCLLSNASLCSHFENRYTGKWENNIPHYKDMATLYLIKKHKQFKLWFPILITYEEI